MSNNVPIGVALALTGGVIQSVGFILQKKGDNKVNAMSDETDIEFSVGRPLTQKDEDNVAAKAAPTDSYETEERQITIWWTGIITYQIGNALTVISLSFTAQSVISPLLAFNIMVKSILSHFIFKERLSRNDVAAILLIIIGITLLIIFGPSSNHNVNLTVNDIKSLFKQMDYIIFLSILSVVILMNYIITKYVEYSSFSSNNNETIMKGKKYLLLSYTSTAAYFRANYTLFIKSFITIISASLISKQTEQHDMNDYFTYLIPILCIISLLICEYFTQKALSYFGASYAVPLDCVFSVILSVFFGGIFFNEFNEMNIIFFVALLITLCGVFVLSHDIATTLDTLYGRFIQVAYADKDTIHDNYPKVIVFGGVLSRYFKEKALKELPFFDNRDPIREEEMSRKPSYSFEAQSEETMIRSRNYFVTKLSWYLPISFLFFLSMCLFAKFEVSFYHYIAMWIVVVTGGLFVFLYRAFRSTRLREIRTYAKNVDGFSSYISFTYMIEDKTDRPITSVCRFGGVRGSSQEMIFVVGLMSGVALGLSAVVAKTFERGKEFFTSTSWDQGRRTDIWVLLLYPACIAHFLLYVNGSVEHGSFGRKFHILCSLTSVVNPPVAFMVYQNFSIFSIICASLCGCGIVAYIILDQKGLTRSDNPAVVHKWSLINLTVEAVTILLSSAIIALNVWALDTDYIFFE